ncbi:MAG: hypothetical protein A3H27_06615 [Acidobacteria bacterium RIFCSPLOWO2_02_FULL_59_13]|nr:MAG: hypothetical protein A3H27_06615 [Acidobacteria bacterium RIFCSPLOWO2_02_FULL_59_13]
MNETTHFADIVIEQINRKIQATTRPPTGDTVFALIRNNCTVREPCGVCGRSHKDARVPAWIFSESGALCLGCAEDLAPALLRHALDLEALYWLPQHLGVETWQDAQIVNSVCSNLPSRSRIRWSNLPDRAELLKLLDMDWVRARVDELLLLYDERAPVRLEEDSRKIIQDPQGFPMQDDFADALPF